MNAQIDRLEITLLLGDCEHRAMVRFEDGLWEATFCEWLPEEALDELRAALKNAKRSTVTAIENLLLIDGEQA